MLTITALKKEKLEEGFLINRLPEVMATLRKRYPGACQGLGEGELKEKVRNAIFHAGEFNIRSARNTERFMGILFRLEKDRFDESPDTAWAHIILKWNAEENLKLAALEKHMRDNLY